jgi:hypothetical protein
MLSSPAIISYATFLGVHHVAEAHLSHVDSPDELDRMRVHLAAYSLGSVLLLDYVDESHAWPLDDFMPKFIGAFVQSPGFEHGETTLEDIVVHIREKDFVLGELKKVTQKDDCSEFWNRILDSTSVFKLLLTYRYMSYASAKKDVRIDDKAQKLLGAGLYCTASWLWGAIPDTPASQTAGREFFAGVFDWVHGNIIPPLREEEGLRTRYS